MAFGRSNSLSINTGATNSIFGQQNQGSQAQPSGSLFGTTSSQAQQAPSLFGNSTNQTQPSSNLFGGTNTGATQQYQPQQSGGLFGSTLGQPQNQSGQSGGGLFGNLGQNQNQNQNQSQNQNGQTGGGLFGNSGQIPNQNQNQPQNGQTGGGLFGNLGQSQNQQSNQQNTGTSLFGGLGQNQNQSQNQQGNNTWGGLGGQNKPAFGASTTQSQSNAQRPSLFGTSVFDNATNPSQPLGLTRGQGQSQQQSVPGVKIDINNVRPTTRFADLHDDLKKQIEQIDAFIKQQESFANQCEALLPNHSTNVSSVTPDVELINSKVETVELSLENDSRAIKSAKDLATSDVKDLTRCVRVIDNLTLPSQFHYGPSSSNTGSRTRISDDDYDVDLVGYFNRQAEAMQQTLQTFTSNLTEIESHLRVIESSTVQQSQQVAAQRASGGAGGHDAVRELADTLRGFENGILDAAGYVGACREGVNELILGRGGEVRNGRGRY